MSAFTHVVVGTNDLANARVFYDDVLAPLGLKALEGARRQRLVLGTGERGIHGAVASRRETSLPR